MRGILINPNDQTVMDCEYDGDYKTIYKLIQNGDSPFDVRQIGDLEGESIFFDDEFLLKCREGEAKPYFYLNGVPDPIGGCALILGVDGEGDSVETKLTVEEVSANVRWALLTLTGWTPTTSREETHPVFGKINVVVGARPIFAESEVSPYNPLDYVVKRQEQYDKNALAQKQIEQRALDEWLKKVKK